MVNKHASVLNIHSLVYLHASFLLWSITCYPHASSKRPSQILKLIMEVKSVNQLVKGSTCTCKKFQRLGEDSKKHYGHYKHL